MSRLRTAAGRGADAVRSNAKPFLIVQAAAFALVLAYYLVPGAPAAMAGVGELKRNGGLALSALSTAVAGFFLPEIARRITGRPGTRAAEVVFQLAFFATIGTLVDLFYRVLGAAFGNEPDVVTVAKKVLCDQLVFSALISIPLSTVAFLWKDVGFSVARTRMVLHENGGFFVRYLPIMVTCLAYWGPVNVATYAMPRDLQFPLFLAAQAAWSLLLLHLNDR